MESSPSPQPASPSALSKAIKIAVIAGIAAIAFAATKTALEQRLEKKKAIEEFDNNRRDIATEMKRELDTEGGLSADTAAKAMNKMRGEIDRLAAKGGKDGQAMKAVAEVMAEIQAKATPYLALIKRIETDNPMDMSTVKDKADLAARREFGKEMLGMNQDLLSTFNSVESNLRGKLQKAGATGKSTDDFVAGFMNGYTRTSRIQIRIRKTDETIAKSLIAMTDLMEASWGKWKRDGENIVFEEDESLKRFNEIANEVQKAGDDQTAAQRELIELQQRK